MPRAKTRSTWLAAVALTFVACRGSATRDGDAPSPIASLETPAGYTRIARDGWSLAVPGEFEPRPPPELDESAPMIWLINQGSSRARGSPYVFFAVHGKPADFPSRVFGLAALDGLKRQAPRKLVLSERQHALGDLIVTDIELETSVGSRKVHEWRRLFVLDGRAYILTFAGDAASARELAGAARKVIDSLVRHPE